MTDKNPSTYQRVYGQLIRLYPRSFQERFAEPMLQTFGDMCREQAAAGNNLGAFALKTYIETLLEIIKEQLKEVVMKTNTRNKRTLIVAGGIFGALAIGLVATMLLNTGSTPIQPGSTIEQAKEQSRGNKAACLVNDEQVENLVRADDNHVYLEKEFSMFDFTVVSGIIDVPAGTQVDVTINSYSDGIATGSALYDGDYGDYNYSVKYLGQPSEWELVSLVGCENG